jgi:hypothetical protein
MKTHHRIVLAIRQALAMFKQACEELLSGPRPEVALARRRSTESARRAKGRWQP